MSGGLPTIVRGTGQYRHCPICGRETEKQTFEVKPGKTNQKVECPEHGELIHK